MRYFITTIVSLLCLAAGAQIPLVMPGDTASANGVRWCLHYDSLLVSTDGGGSWRNGCVLSVFPSRIMQANADSSVIILDYNDNSYLYSLPANKLSVYVPVEPIAPFLKAPVVYASITNDYNACFNNRSSKLTYARSSTPSVLHASRYKMEGDGGVERHYNYKKTKAWRHAVNVHQLQTILQAVNEGPVSMPTIKDFGIATKDRQRHPAAASRLDTICIPVLKEIFDQFENGGSGQASNWFMITMVNSKKDTLLFVRRYGRDPHSWHLPWMVWYHKTSFKCYSLDFSRFINSCIPSDFEGKKLFSNDELLKYIEQYFESRSNIGK